MALLALFSYEIDGTASDHDRAAVESEIESELHKPGRVRWTPLSTSYLVRFEQDDMDDFFDAMDALGKTITAFRYTAVGWNPAVPVSTYPR